MIVDCISKCFRFHLAVIVPILLTMLTSAGDDNAAVRGAMSFGLQTMFSNPSEQTPFQTNISKRYAI